jgi:hypothetical protein
MNGMHTLQMHLVFDARANSNVPVRTDQHFEEQDSEWRLTGEDDKMTKVMNLPQQHRLQYIKVELQIPSRVPKATDAM